MIDIGIFSFNTDYTIRPGELAQALEERGFESLWVGEHTHIPACRRTPYPAPGGLPDYYTHMMDPFVSLTAAAALTTKLKLGLGVCLVVERDPITLAKEVATLDVLSHGRFLFGVGGGWNAEEMENHGTAFDTRFALLRERIEAMKTIWTEDEPSYHGEFVNFDRIWSYPKPCRKPHPPIIMGSATTASLRRTVDYCDGWAPLDVKVRDIPAAIVRMHRLAEEAGRDPRSIELSMFSWLPPDAAKIASYAGMGITRVIIFAPVEGREQTLRFVDEQAKIMAELA